MSMMQTFGSCDGVVFTRVQVRSQKSKGVGASDSGCLQMPNVKSMAHETEAEFKRWNPAWDLVPAVSDDLIFTAAFKKKSPTYTFSHMYMEKFKSALAPLGTKCYYSASKSVVRSLVIPPIWVLPFMWQGLLKAW